MHRQAHLLLGLQRLWYVYLAAALVLTVVCLRIAMHMVTIIFFITVLRPYGWHWSINLFIYVVGSMAVLLVTYRYFVRYTWIGAVLNGRRHARPGKSPPQGAVTAPG